MLSHRQVGYSLEHQPSNRFGCFPVPLLQIIHINVSRDTTERQTNIPFIVTVEESRPISPGELSGQWLVRFYAFLQPGPVPI